MCLHPLEILTIHVGALWRYPLGEARKACALFLLHRPLPATARTSDHPKQAEHEIDRNEVADLIQLLTGFGECFAFDGLATGSRQSPLVLQRRCYRRSHAVSRKFVDRLTDTNFLLWLFQPHSLLCETTLEQMQCPGP
jgi:hypothetical protein